MTEIPHAPMSAGDAVRAANLGAPGSTKVTIEALLNARNILQARFEYMNKLIHRAQFDLVVPLCGSDPVSPYAAKGFNDKIQAMLTEMKKFVKSLGEAAEILDQNAKSYGATEEQITASFQSFSKSRGA